MGSEVREFTVVMLPWPAHGHITPFLELAKKLSHKNFHCYICSTKVNLPSIEKRIQGKIHNVKTIELQVPTTHELPDPRLHTTNGLPRHLHKPLAKALKLSEPEFKKLLKTLNPDLLIHDVMLPWACSAAKALSVPSVNFDTSNATMLSYFFHLARFPGKEYPFPAMKLTEFQLSTLFAQMRELEGEEKVEEKEKERDSHDDFKAIWESGRILLTNSTEAVEGKYMDYLSQLIECKIMPVGAMIRDPTTAELDDGDCSSDELMDWLGKKGEGSTVLVSFGSEYFLKKEEMQEIAYGLEMSEAINFVWVVRSPKGDESKPIDVLPKGFFERVEERGRVVEKWAPQARILSHPSVGGFVSHCGWNSLMEGLEFMVPIIAMPMHLDQPMNAKLVVELGYGVEVQRDDGKGRLQREEIAKVIKGVVFGGKGRDLRGRAKDLREEVRVKSREEFEGVVEMLEQLCCKKSC